jgi:glycosyltransferase involved in cell wall biosynthesis
MNQVSGKFLVSVIIPTMATRERADLLKRAIRSIKNSSSGLIYIITVVNGARHDAELCDWLKLQENVRFEYCPVPSAPAAVLRGRELVETEYFSTLDDDDEYLPGVTDDKLAALLASPAADLVVGNYYQHTGGADVLRYDYEELAAVPADPWASFRQFNWLTSGNALYRSASIGIHHFADQNAFAEWTYLAYRFCLEHKRVAVLDQPVFRCYGDTPNSLSKSAAYFDAYIPLFNRMLAQSPPRAIARWIHFKLGSVHHDASVHALRNGQRKLAWRHHWKSLTEVAGWRFLSYTRHLLK